MDRVVDSTIAVSGYSITEQIYAGTRTLVYRGDRNSDQKPVVIKLMRSEYPSFSEIVQFRNQYTITKNLDLLGIVKPYSLELYRNGYAIVMEDFGGVSLRNWAKIETLNVISTHSFLAIAIQITTHLEALHRNRVIHKDIKPDNILINPETHQIKLIDFSISSLLPRETQQLQNPNVLEGTLAYISPEQTGRMNRGIDYRTDFYSLGITFYELLTGQLPFQSHDPIELVHFHIAKIPPNAQDINLEIPSIISDIIAKLMAKNAEDRYQSASGIKHDLETCLSQYQATKNIIKFELGKRDITDYFLIPEKLYGREREVDVLLKVFDRVSKGHVEMMLVAGFSGIGKTAVVNEVHKPIVQQRGYFIKGKYDQFQRNIPFSAFVQAFKDLMSQLLGESNDQIKIWKNKILEAVGENGQVIIEVIPELEKIIDKQSPVLQLSGSAAQNRFNLLFHKFIRVFTTQDHPLVIFLDDLQWADSASLKLIQLLMSENNTGYMLLIGAYRDNEVFPAHPLMLTLDEIGKTGSTINTITLATLPKTVLNQLVADTLNCSVELSEPLTELVYQKTRGNPFFSTQFLKSLYEDGLIKFDLDARYWLCDIAQVKALALTDDVVEFMALQLQKLPLETQDVLKLAACIGNQFDLNTLAIVRELSSLETAANLWKALQEGLIIPTTEVYKFFTYSDESTTLSVANATYKFLHDRVQQAAYSLIPESQKRATHLQIGRLLLTSVSQAEQEDKLFDIVGHWNLGIDLITQPAEQEQLARMNLNTGRKAKNSTAYGAAFKYCQVGIGLLDADCWQSQYDLALALYTLAAEVAYLSGYFQQMEEFAVIALQHTKTILDQIQIYEVKIQAYIVQNNTVEAVQTGLTVLWQLEIKFPLHPSDLKVLLNLLTTKISLLGKPISSLSNLPTMLQPEKQATTRLLSKVLSAAFIGAPDLLPLLVFKNINLLIKYGNDKLSPFAYSWYGLILCGVLIEIEAGYKFGELALKLLADFDSKEIEARTNFIVYSFIKHWKIPITDTISSLLETYQCGLDTGDTEYAAWAIVVYFHHSFLNGVELTELEDKFKTYASSVAGFKQETALNYLNTSYQTVLNLLNITEHPASLNGTAFDEEAVISLQLKSQDKTGLYCVYIHKLILAYLFDDVDVAVEFAISARKYIGAVTALHISSSLYWYESLTMLSTYGQAQPHTQKKILQQVHANQKKLKKWMHYAPINFAQKFYLVEAEKYRVLQQKIQAIDYYDRAISLAKENKYLNEEALANELAAKFYLEWGKEQFAQKYMIEAYYCYSRWGSSAKVKDLEKRYPQLLIPIFKREDSIMKLSETIHLTSSATLHSTSNTTISILDLAGVIKASQAISGTLQLEELLSKLMQIVLENAGAKFGALILNRDEELIIEATASIINDEVAPSATILQSIPLIESQEVPQSIINYVKNTLITLIISDASIETQWLSDSYIQQEQTKSILCLPIVHQSKLIGILYLENSLTVGVFTSDRVELLNLLCSQTAIALENARLYKASQQALEDLQKAQLQLVQSEKMSALGNLVAGIAHEINNPLGFIAGNVQPALDYIKDVFGLLDLCLEKNPYPDTEINKIIKKIDLEYVREDLPKVIFSIKEGVQRICEISDSLRTFSRADTENKVAFNIHDGLDSTILILKHRLKANEKRPQIEVIKNYDNLPSVECFAGQLNQVFMNLLANAIDSLEESNTGRTFSEIQANPNRITITTKIIDEKQQVVISIKDNGKGMTEEVKQKIFDHLFTTKAVGKGTGLGLAIAHQIIVEKHDGSIQVNSAPEQGAEFVIQIPI